MKRFWIIGGGKFGNRAAETILKHRPDAKITLVDQRGDQLPVLNPPSRALCMDGINFLHARLARGRDPDWIIPAIPLHVAFEWTIRSLSDTFTIQKTEIPQKIFESLPHPIHAANGAVHASIANFICPDDCPAPAVFCTFTRAPRPYPSLHEMIGAIAHPHTKIIAIQSRQLFPGVGGILPADLFNALDEARSEGDYLDILLSTACRCHAVLDLFRRIRKTF